MPATIIIRTGDNPVEVLTDDPNEPAVVVPAHEERTVYTSVTRELRITEHEGA